MPAMATGGGRINPAAFMVFLFGLNIRLTGV